MLRVQTARPEMAHLSNSLIQNEMALMFLHGQKGRKYIDPQCGLDQMKSKCATSLLNLLPRFADAAMLCWEGNPGSRCGGPGAEALVSGLGSVP